MNYSIKISNTEKLSKNVKKVYFENENTVILDYNEVRKLLIKINSHVIGNLIFNSDNKTIGSISKISEELTILGKVVKSNIRARTILNEINNILTNNENIPLMKIEEMEIILIAKALDKYKGNIHKASKDLGIFPSTVRKKIQKYNLLNKD